MSYQTYLNSCTLCPRECKVDRQHGVPGMCKSTSELKVARAALHMWEEPCISGKEGSGAVFFSGCALGCVFCQNQKISRGQAGKVITIDRLSDIFLELQQKGANNINLVTPSHFVLQVADGIELAKSKGLQIPIVYNSSGYEKVESLKILDGLVDIYLPDFKYINDNIAKKYSNAPGYAKFAGEAVAEMVRQVGKPVFDGRGMMQQGVIVRHLALPGYGKDSKRIIKYLYQTFGDNIYISLLNQYTPMSENHGFKEINRVLTQEEYDELVEYAVNLGVKNGFIQIGETAKESFIPDFNGEGV